MKRERIVFHIDMDAFFAAIEERDNPHLRGKPIVVGADPKGGKGRGVVSTANYEARKYGIHSAMPISQAYRRCPQAVFLPVDIERYSRVSENIAELIKKNLSRDMIMEQASIDEFYVEARNISWEKAVAFARNLKAAIYKKEQLTCSIGIGPNPLVAKIASDFKKPDGLTLVRPQEVLDFLAPLEIRKIPGIGPKTEEILVSRGIRKVEDLRRMTRPELKDLFGKWGEVIYERARGIDESPVGVEEEPKSIGEQETFEKDTTNRAFLIERLMALCESVWERFGREGVRPRTIVLMVRFADFETKTRSHTLPQPVPSLEIFKQEALALLMPFFDKRENPHRKAIRLLGIRGEKLSAIQ
jgi:DNA polymerase IV (DinB-like DNA polymerase)